MGQRTITTKSVIRVIIAVTTRISHDNNSDNDNYYKSSSNINVKTSHNRRSYNKLEIVTLKVTIAAVVIKIIVILNIVVAKLEKHRNCNTSINVIKSSIRSYNNNNNYSYNYNNYNKIHGSRNNSKQITRIYKKCF